MPGSITDMPEGELAHKPFPGEDGREWELVTHNVVAAITAHRTLKGVMVVRREKPEAPTEYAIRGEFDYDAAVGIVAELNALCGSDVFEKHPRS